MSKTKIPALAELEKLNTEFNDRVRASRSAIEADRQKLDELTAKLDSAVTNGDMTAFKAHTAEKNDLLLEIEALTAFVDRIEADRCAGFDDDTVRASWGEYVTVYNDGVTKRLDGFEKARRALFDGYVELCKLQNECLRIRDKYTALLSRNAVNTFGGPINFASLVGVDSPGEALSVFSCGADDELLMNSLSSVAALEYCNNF